VIGVFLCCQPIEKRMAFHRISWTYKT
jgi:hypothetical protein